MIYFIILSLYIHIFFITEEFYMVKIICIKENKFQICRYLTHLIIVFVLRGEFIIYNADSIDSLIPNNAGISHREGGKIDQIYISIPNSLPAKGPATMQYRGR